MIKKILGLVFILSVSLNIAFIIYMMAGPSQAEAPKATSKLELSEKQKKEIEPVRQKIHLRNEAIKKEMAGHQVKLMDLLSDEAVDKKAAFLCIDKINGLQKEIQQNTVEEVIALKSHMTPQQCNCLLEGMESSLKKSAKPCNCSCCTGASAKAGAGSCNEHATAGDEATTGK
ncbi:MAG: hypothetical protein GY765_26725 [bacterium]|nr:hypothetical protein [bacterium]